MDRKNTFVMILGVVLISVLIAVIIFLVRKYEKESLPQGQPVVRAVSVPEKFPQIKPEESQDSPQEGANQFSTENGKLLQ